MSIFVQFRGQTAHGIEAGVEAIGVPPDEADRWSQATSDPAWRADRDDFVSLSDGTNSELIG